MNAFGDRSESNGFTSKAYDPKHGEAWFVYMLRCRDGSIYTGCTNNIQKRLATHNSGKGARYTRARLPVVLAYVEQAVSYSAALKREYSLKQFTKSAKEKLIDSFDFVSFLNGTSEKP